jgi:hypothetical protein
VRRQPYIDSLGGESSLIVENSTQMFDDLKIIVECDIHGRLKTFKGKEYN